MRTLPVLLLLASAIPVAAQEPAADEPPTAPLALYAFQFAPGLQEVFVRIADGSYEGLTLSRANLIGPVNAALRDGEVTLHREVRTPVGETTWPVVARANIASLLRPLLVLVPDDDPANLTYRSFPLDLADYSVPLGSYELLNLSPHPVRGTVGNRTRLVAPEASANLRPTDTPGAMMAVEFQFREDDRWRTLTTTRWAFRPDRRTLLCAFLDPTDRRMKLRSIPDRLLEPETTGRTAP